MADGASKSDFANTITELTAQVEAIRASIVNIKNQLNSGVLPLGDEEEVNQLLDDLRENLIDASDA